MIGAALSLSKVWLDRYADFMLVLGALLVPVGGVLIARFVLLRRRVEVPELYDPRGRFARWGGFSVPGMLAWAAGSAVFFLTKSIGSTLPALLTAIAIASAGELAESS